MPGEAGIIRRIRRRAERQHWPKPSVPALACQGGSMMALDAYLIWLVLHDAVTPLSLAAFGLLELLLLSLFADVELIPIPRENRFSAQRHGLLGANQRRGWLGSIFVCVFMGIWTTIVYAFCLMVDGNLLLLASDHDPLDVLVRLNILWPLLLSAALAVSAMLGDWGLWHRRGGLFVPEMAQPTMPRILTFLLAPIPAVMACFTFIDESDSTALFAWCVTYVAIRCLFDLGMVALQFFGLYILHQRDAAEPLAAGVQAV